MKPVFVIGHKNPDTDSICSAICYANLKRILTGREHIPCRAGDINAETSYVLEHFGVEPPRYLESLQPRLSDVQYRDVAGIDAQLSLRRAWQYMSDHNIQTVSVVDEENYLHGILTLSDIARFYMEDQDAHALAESHTSYRNLVDVLNGELVVGDPEGNVTQGKVVVAAANPDVMEDYIAEHDLVILGNRYESQLCSIEMKAGCIIIGLGSKVSRTIRKLAQEAGCNIIATPLDTYTCSKVINQAVPVSHVMRTNKLVTFQHKDLVSDVKATVAKRRIRYYPILDENSKYIGMISQRNLLDMEQQEVILVDHNEKDQAVDGIRTARVTEIIDHHRIDSVETSHPIYFRNQPLGCTATIVAQMYQEHQVPIERPIAGLLCSAILSDTLMFRSPTCTEKDKEAAQELAKIAGIDMHAFAAEMFHAGSNLEDKTPEEIFYQDYKKFIADEVVFGVGQISFMSEEELQSVKERLLPYMAKECGKHGVQMVFFMLTNIIKESTELLCYGEGAEALVLEAFHTEVEEGSCRLKGVVSRKKQLIPRFMAALQQQ